MQIEVHLLLLRPRRPVRWHVVRGVLHPHDPLPINHNAVPRVVAVDDTSQETRPERALRLDVACVYDEDSPDDLQRMFLPP